MQGAFFLSGLPPYSAACGGGSAQSERTVQVQAITRSARAKWVRAWVRISSSRQTRCNTFAASDAVRRAHYMHYAYIRHSEDGGLYIGHATDLVSDREA